MTHFKMIIFTGLCFFMVFSPPILATAQQPDVLIIKGEKHHIFTNPLADLIKTDPAFKTRLRDTRHSIDNIVSSTANWRGYVACFEIKGKKLYLTDITIERRISKGNESFKTDHLSIMPQLFQGKQKVPAKWFSGLLVIPRGELKKYVHMGYSSTYEKYLLIGIKRGKVKKMKHYTAAEYEDFRKRQFRAFKKTETYQKLLDSYLKDAKTKDPASAERFIAIHNIEYTSKILLELE